jgi:hypothetical protein
MAIPSGLSAQLGVAIETTPGTRVAPAVFPELLSESMRRNPQFLRSAGLRVRMTQHRIIDSGYRVSGDVQMEAATETIGPFLRAAIGAVATTGSGTYTHVITPSVTTLRPSMTVQIGRPTVATSAVVECFEYTGCYVNAWELSIQPDAFVTASFTFDGMLEDVSQTLATPTYPTLTPLTFLHATLTASGGTECVNSLNLTGSLSNSVRAQVCPTNPGTNKITPSGMAAFGGSFGRDFRNTDMYDDMVAGTEATLTVALVSGSYSLTITGNARLMDAGPNVGGPDILTEDVPFEFLHASTDASAFTATLVNNVATI